MWARIGLFLALPLAVVAGPILTMDTAVVSIKEGNHGARIVFPVPLTLLRVGMNFLPDHLTHEFEMDHIPELEQYHDSLVKMAKELRSMEDGTLVSVVEHDTKVNVRKSGGSFIVDVNEGKNRVHVKFPIKIAERVIKQTEDGYITPQEILAAIDGTLFGKVVEVTDGENEVKIWVW